MHCGEFESVYEAFYKLSAKPFRLSPDPQFFYPSAGHKRALSYLLYGLNQGEGFVVITGAPGTGKTTLAHKLLSQIDAESVVVAHLASTQIEAEDLLRLVAASFKLRSEHVSKASLLKDIESFLLGCARERKRCLLVVDEAQNLPPRSIEELRMLSNFQVGNRALMQVFLLGQEQFRIMLDSLPFEQLRQRVIADYHLHPLDAVETGRYIEARLQHVGWQNDPQFDSGAHAMIFEYTEGLPRRINMFCDRLLLFGYLEGLHTLTRENVSGVIAELHNEILPRSSNVVFTPSERPLDRIATVESHPPESLAAPSPPADTLAAPSVAVNTEVLPPEPAKPLNPSPPAAAPLHPAKPVEPVSTEIERTKPTRKIAGVNPLRATPDPGIADFLLASPPAGTQRGLSTLDSLPRGLLSLRPSLAGTEMRWLLIIISACVVLLSLAFWVYPSIQGALQGEPAQEESRSPFMEDTTAPSVGLMQQISDPSEDVLTEKRILASPSSPITEPDEVVAESGTKNKLPPAISAENTPVSPALDPPTRASTREESPVKAKPEAVEAPQATSPSTTPPVTAAAVGLAGEPSSTATAAMPKTDASVSVTGISQGELAQLVSKFTRYYQEGDLPQFLSLFDPQVRTENSNTIDAIRSDYSDLFKQTALREILFGDIHWENSGRLAQGMGLFEVRINTAEGTPPRSLKGDITFHIEKKNSNLVIVGLYHTLR